MKKILFIALIFSYYTLALGNTNFFVQTSGGKCYPDFLSINGPMSYPDIYTNMSEYGNDLDEFKKPCSPAVYNLGSSACLASGPFKPIENFVPSSTGGNCGSGKACYCELISSNHLLPLSCNPSASITSFQTCYFSSGQNSLAYKNSSSCNGGICYRIPKDPIAYGNIIQFYSTNSSSPPPITTSDLSDIANNNGGICLPEFKCEPKPLGHNMEKRTLDVCAEGFEEEEIEGKTVCINPSYRSEIIVPDEIDFEVEQSSCSMIALEMFDGEISDDQSFLDLMKPLPAGKLKVSPALLKYTNYNRYLSSLEWLWGKADSRHVTSPSGQLHERMKLGGYAKKAMKEYEVFRRYINVFKEYELDKIFKEVEETLEEANEDPTVTIDPLITLRAQVQAMEKMQNILPLEIEITKNLLGGEDYINSLLLETGSEPSYGSLFNDNKTKMEYKRSLAYLRDASSSLGSSMWERRTKGSRTCPSRWRPWAADDIGCKKLNNEALECKPTPGLMETFLSIPILGPVLHLASFGTITIVTGLTDLVIDFFSEANPKLVNIKRCIDESIEVAGSVYQDSENLNGKFINSIYPNSLLNTSSTVTRQTSGNFFGHRVKIASRNDFIDLLKRKYKNYANERPDTFNSDEIDLLVSKFAGVDLLNGVIPEPSFLNSYIVPGKIEDLKNHKLSLTPLEYIFYRNLIQNPEESSIYVTKSDIDEFKANDENFSDTLKDETFKLMGESLYSNFLKMHFTRKQNQYHTSEVVGGAGFYNIGSSHGDAGETLGYIKELYAMTEYIYKYQIGLMNGYREQINCLNDRISESSNSIDGNSLNGGGIVVQSGDLELLELTAGKISAISSKIGKINGPKPSDGKSIIKDINSAKGTKVSSNDPSEKNIQGNENKSSSTVSSFEGKQKNLAKKLSGFRNKKLAKISKLKNIQPAQIKDSNDMLYEALVPVVNSISKNPKTASKLSSLNLGKQKSKKAKKNKNPKTKGKTKSSSIKATDDEEKLKNISFSIGGDGYGNKNKNRTKQNIAENKKILSYIKKNKNKFNPNDKDTLFNIVSKAYVRAGMPRVLETKSRVVPTLQKKR